MSGYAFTPYALPALGSAGAVALLAAHALRRRSMPGALPLARMMLVALPWTLGEALELSAIDPSAKILWFRIQGALYLPIVTAELLFALEYADLGQWVNRRVLVSLSIPIVLVAVLMTQGPGPDHPFWLELRVNHAVHATRPRTFWILAGYGYLLGLAPFLIFVSLLRSPLQRRAVALCLLGHVAMRVAFFLDVTGRNPLDPMTAAPVAAALTAVLYGLALFRFQLLDVVSVAHRTVIEQMGEGLLVVDPQRRVLAANRAAERMLRAPLAHLVGSDVSRFLRASPGVDALLGARDDLSVELRTESGDAARQYEVRRTALADRRGLALGHLLLFRDVTDQRQAQAQLIEQQRALAVSQERERLGRELHDGLGQVLGYLKMQVQAARALIEQGRSGEAACHLAQAGAVAQDAHADVREHILGARAGSGCEVDFLAALRRYLKQFSSQYGLATELTVAPDLDASRLEPTEAVQLLRIIQEGLTNARKHGRAHHAHVRLGICAGRAEATLQDDGTGFDPASIQGLGEQKFGLGFMRERAQSVGGTVRIDSAPGAGTRITVSMPLREVRS